MAVDLRSPDAPADIGGLWDRVAVEVRSWLADRGADVRAAFVLVPFAELLPVVRRAFAQVPGWLPRLHTTRTLLRELAPAAASAAHDDAPSGRPAIDALTAARLLRRLDWGARWARRDRRSFEHAVSTLMRTTHALMTAAACLPPSQREAYWNRARALAVRIEGAAATDGALQRLAIEWAASAPPPDSDRLVQWRPSAWILIDFGGEDPLSAPLLDDAAETPCLRLRLDPAAADPFDAATTDTRISLHCTADGEAEAQAAAHAIVEAVAAGATPVALIAEDRALVRRIRALLERSGTRLYDETGWSLATTRAGADALTALRAAHPAARPDDRLDWLKTRSAGADEALVASLEALWRRARGIDDASRRAAQALWARERGRLESFAQPGRRSLSRWLGAFDALLSAARPGDAWAGDPAVEQLRRALLLDPGTREAAAAAVLQQTLDLEEFTRWVDLCLEQARFVPPYAGNEAAVIVTPLARAIGRPFATVVLPGADERRLGADAERGLLFGDATLRALGIADRATLRRRQALAFVQLLRAPRLIVVRRRVDGDEALAPSPLLDRLQAQRRARGLAPLVEHDVEPPQREVPRTGTPQPAPTAGARLPSSWSASAAETLRQCPYRFYARSVLGLHEPDELVDEADKSDYGRWLHATLERFHATRDARGSTQSEHDHLRRCGAEALRRMIDAGEASEAALLPYTADLPAFARRYLAWLSGHEAQGWRFESGEVFLRLEPGRGALALHGRIDRVDATAAGDARLLIDYKTSARQALARKVALPLEDTQLAVYAALLLDALSRGVPLRAAYLALDDPEAVRAVEHPNVTESAQRLRSELASERQRIEAGAALPALGSGAVCETCEARGLCRRDHWPPTAPR